MAKLTRGNDLLELSREEAELLRSFLTHVLVNCDSTDLDPQYEDWSWKTQKSMLEQIAAVLPKAV